MVEQIDAPSGPWIIFPNYSSISDFIYSSRSVHQFLQVCEGLIRGLGYLHGLRIAHRDIKTSNLLVDLKPARLKIIDFDLAKRMKDENEEVEDEVFGTEGYMAPEIKKSAKYSPIKADRWACGRMLLSLLDSAKEEAVDRQLMATEPKVRRMREFGRALMAQKPAARPAVSEWWTWHGPTLVPSMSSASVRLRSRSRSPEDSVKKARTE